LSETVRLDKLLSNMGYGSRKDVGRFIKDGLVEVCGRVAADGGEKVQPDWVEIVFNGRRVVYKKYVYLMMNKPEGIVTAAEDAHGERTFMDLIGSEYLHFELSAAGRLDKDTEGFLLLTNDGEFIHNIISPAKHVIKEYYAEVAGRLDSRAVEAFENGIELADGYKCMPAGLEILAVDPENMRTKVLVQICEGKYHQVKRMFHALGAEVAYLKRLSIGGVILDEKLKPGEYRELTGSELEVLKNGNE
jgi:16S rRNA pseudouridine516 synthase